MKKIGEIKNEIIPLLKESGVIHSFIFGSYAKNLEKISSDLDIAVELQSGKTLLDLVKLKLDLEKKIGVKVDIVTPNAISPLLRNIIQKEKIDIL